MGQMKKTSNKAAVRRTIMVCITIALCVAVFVGSAMAYLTDNEFHVNELATKEVETEITEDFPDPDPLEPGQEFTKTVRIENNGKPSCYVRVQVLFSDGEMRSVCTLCFEGEDGINTADWTYRDGWYYYNSALEPGALTSPLFTSVKTDERAEADDLHEFDIFVRQESRQAEGHENAFDAFGA